MLIVGTTLGGGWSLVRTPVGLDGWGFELAQPPERGRGQESEFSIMANDSVSHAYIIKPQ